MKSENLLVFAICSTSSKFKFAHCKPIIILQPCYRNGASIARGHNQKNGHYKNGATFR